jgi:hypothetical protein
MFGEGQDLRLELQRVMSEWPKEWGEDGSMGLLLISAGDKGKGGLLDRTGELAILW